ncbi:MAG: hypothetical protein M1838_004344, partial [Thelocarpon superellum]
MEEQTFLNLLEDLTGRVAIVTGGGGGIGLEASIYLARKGATVYVASRNKEKSEAAIKEAEERLDGKGGPIRFLALNLSSIRDVQQSAQEFLKLESRLDLLICNAGVALAYRDELSPDGYERTFATNHLGHFVLVTTLLDLVKQTARAHGDARIVVVSSIGLKGASKIDYSRLQTRVANDGKSVKDLGPAMMSYFRSKLMNAYFAAELGRRLREEGVHNVYWNVTTTDLVSSHGQQHPVPMVVQNCLRKTIGLFTNSAQDSARCEVFLAASKEVADKDINGEYWEPTWSWSQRYTGCKVIKNVTPLAVNVEEQKK